MTDIMWFQKFADRAGKRLREVYPLTDQRFSERLASLLWALEKAERRRRKPKSTSLADRQRVLLSPQSDRQTRQNRQG